MKLLLSYTSSAFFTLSAVAVAQSGGVLTPPAAPGQTMKSLDQVEPRIPLVDGAAGVTVDAGTGMITISQSGSYYLTGNLAITSGNGIVINASGVTLDLSGYSITSAAGTPTGVAVEINNTNITVRNGHILSGVAYDSGASGDQFLGAGFARGIYAALNTDILIEAISVKGVDLEGISCVSSTGSRVRNCSVNTAGGTGIRAGIVESCNAMNTGGAALFGAIVSNSYGYSLGDDGISGSVIKGCVAVTNGGSDSARGIDNASLVESCYAYSINPDGGNAIASANVVNSYALSYADYEACIEASGNVSSCYAQSYGSTAIYANNVTNSYGILADGALGFGSGISALGSVNACYGVSSKGSGIFGHRVSNSYGKTTRVSSSNDCGIRGVYSVSNSYGVVDTDNSSTSGAGISGYVVTNSYGRSDGSSVLADGIHALYSCQNSRGEGRGGYGVQSNVINNCYGSSSSESGISAKSVSNSYGYSFSDYGIAATTIRGSYGESHENHGISGTTIMSSYGKTEEATKAGIRGSIVSFSVGSNGVGTLNVGINCDIAVSCRAVYSVINAAQKFQGTP